MDSLGRTIKHNMLNKRKLFFILFSCLCFSVIIDPGNSLFKIKEVFFVLIFLLGISTVKKIPKSITLIYFCVGVLLPIYGVVLGILLGEYYSLDMAMMYIKSFLFISLMLFLHEYSFGSSKLFSLMTLMLIPVTLIIVIVMSELNISDLDVFPKDTLFVSRRTFGPLLIEPCVYYKTSPLLLFGLSYICTRRINVFNILVLIAGAFTMFYSGTRANIFSVVILYGYFFWLNVVSKNVKFRRFFVFMLCMILIFYLPVLFSDVFFNANEPSLDVKTQLIGSYWKFWNEKPMNLIWGSGLGSGMPTTVRGIEYMMEPTYFEIVRFWGILLFPLIFFLLILLPIYLFYKSYSISCFNSYRYVLIPYILYVFIEIPSNPLLLSSTGMIVYSIAFSVSYSLYKSRISC